MGLADRRSSVKADAVQSTMGNFGRWQLGISVALALSGIPGSWFKVGIVFLAPPVDFYCASPSAPAGLGDSDVKYKCSVPMNTSSGTKMMPCKEFVYDRSVFTETIITEWNLVCDRAQLANVVQMLFMLGFLVGCFVGGWVADRYGRKPPLLWGALVQAITGVLCALVPWFTVFLALRFLSAVAVGAITVTGFVIMIEIIGGKWRTPVNALGTIPFAMGHSALAGLAYLLRDWRDLQLAISIPVALQLAYYWIVPESPRWLLTAGRDEEAVQVLRKAAETNKIEVPDWDKALAGFKEGMDKPEAGATKPGVLTLVRTPVIRRCTIIMFANWFACGLVFYGLVQYMGQVAGNIFINGFLSGALEIPGILIGIVALVKLGRRRTLIISQTFTGISCLAIMLVPYFGLPQWCTVMLAALGVMGQSTAFPCVYIYSAELFPTVVRNMGIGTASTLARVGSMLSPFVATLNKVWPSLPPMVFGFVPLLAGVFVYLLPETLNRELPDTVAEIEAYGKKEKEVKEGAGTVNPGFTEERL